MAKFMLHLVPRWKVLGLIIEWIQSTSMEPNDLKVAGFESCRNKMHGISFQRVSQRCAVVARWHRFGTLGSPFKKVYPRPSGEVA